MINALVVFLVNVCPLSGKSNVTLQWLRGGEDSAMERLTQEYSPCLWLQGAKIVSF